MSIPSTRDSRPSTASAPNASDASTATASTLSGTRAKRIGTISAVIPNAERSPPSPLPPSTPGRCPPRPPRSPQPRPRGSPGRSHEHDADQERRHAEPERGADDSAYHPLGEKQHECNADDRHADRDHDTQRDPTPHPWACSVAGCPDQRAGPNGPDTASWVRITRDRSTPTPGPPPLPRPRIPDEGAA